MTLLRKILGNHVLVNLTFGLVILLGVMAYINLPRARDPEINFNWISIMTILPGASSSEVEKRITDPLEDAISRTVKDIRFVSSTSRNGISSILVRFNQLSDADFRDRVEDLRREVQSTYTGQLPAEALNPQIREITTSSGFPMAIIAVTAESSDDNFRHYTAVLKRELERLKGVNEAITVGIEKPELHIAFYPDRLEGLGVTPEDLANTVHAYFRDVSIGDIDTPDGRWLIRLEGTGTSLKELEKFPVVGAKGVVELGSVADIYRASAKPTALVRFHHKPAVMMSITKQAGVNTLELLAEIRHYIAQQNRVQAKSGYHLTMIDDQTVSTRHAISVMQQNALIGLILVVLVSYLFLGARIALLTSAGIPFTLAATFLIIHSLGMTLNNSVLLGVVIALGMLVDDAVVVVETIYYQLQRGGKAMDAAIAALVEVAAPVFTSVLTTVSVFLPLMLLPGILGDFLRVIPLVVTVALSISLLEAFWMLPAHVAAMRISFDHESPMQRRRRIATRRLRHYYSLLLIRVMRRPWLSLGGIALVALVAAGVLAAGVVKFNFFASDPYRMIYVSAELPNNATLKQSLAVAEQLERKAVRALQPGELRASIVYSGQMYTETEPLFGDNYAQVFISLNPIRGGLRGTYQTVAALEKAVGNRLGDARVSFFVPKDGPPVGQPINAKIRGDNFDEIQAVVDQMRAFMQRNGAFKDINTDFKAGSPELKLALNGDAIKRAGLVPSQVTSALQSYVDGVLISQYQDAGEQVDVRLLAKNGVTSLDDLLRQTLMSKSGAPVALRDLVYAHYGRGQQNIRHYNFSRAITLRADIKDDRLDTVAANHLLQQYWNSIKAEHPDISIDFSGELDDIQESINGISMLFVFGLGLIYLILGTQFKSYTQPLIILVSVPLAFVGVIFGLVATGNPMSLNTLYGIVALSGIAVNSAIVLVAAANARLAAGMSPLHATIYAGRRRVIPILITSLTTIAGLFSLAVGFGGHSLQWGPIATAIVSGLLVSTMLVLIVIPLLYHASLTARPRQWLRGKRRVNGE